jgi:hypothetical protein
MKPPTKSQDRPSDSATGSRFTIYDLKGPSPSLSQWSRIPDLTREAFRLVWRAGRNRFLLVVVLQFVSAAMIGLQLVVGRRVLQELMALAGNGQVLRLAPELGLLVGATVLTGFLGALVGHQQRYLTELVGKHSSIGSSMWRRASNWRNSKTPFSMTSFLALVCPRCTGP